MVQGIDVASYQPRDLTTTINRLDPRPEHVVVRLYLPYESPPQQHSRDQINSARDNGCSVGGYMWLYRGAAWANDVDSALELAASVGLTLPVLWVDLEPYTDGSLPSHYDVLSTLQYIEMNDVRAGIYTGKWVIDRMGGPTAFSPYELWTADYSVRPSTEPPLDVPLYGGWAEASGHQWTSTPLDRDVFLSSVTTT